MNGNCSHCGHSVLVSNIILCTCPCHEQRRQQNAQEITSWLYQQQRQLAAKTKRRAK